MIKVMEKEPGIIDYYEDYLKAQNNIIINKSQLKDNIPKEIGRAHV